MGRVTKSPKKPTSSVIPPDENQDEKDLVYPEDYEKWPLEKQERWKKNQIIANKADTTRREGAAPNPSPTVNINFGPDQLGGSDLPPRMTDADVEAEKRKYRAPRVDELHNRLYGKMMSTGNMRTNVVGKKIYEKGTPEQIDDYEAMYGNAVVASKENGPASFRPFFENHFGFISELFPKE